MENGKNYLVWMAATLMLSAAVSVAVSSLLWHVLPAKTIVYERNITLMQPMPPEKPAALGNETGAPEFEKRLKSAIETTKPSVVHIVSVSYEKYPLARAQVTASGSGFIATTEGDVITNAHVLGNSKNVTILLSDGGIYRGTVVGTDQDTDLAVVRIESNLSFVPVEFANSDRTYLGQFVIALGSPYRLSNSAAFGIVSGLNRTFQAEGDTQVQNVIQTDSAINPGNSGGPLVDLDGNVIGVNSAVVSKTGGFEGIGLAIPSNLAKDIAFQIIASGEIIRPWMGVSMRTINNQTAGILGLFVSKGVMMLEVAEGSPADRSGLQGTFVKKDLTEYVPGDIIVEMDGVEIDEAEDVIRIINSHKPGDTSTIRFYRADKLMTTSIIVGKKPATRLSG
ncbi:MAG: trypsin-like peptidase domain-containing protein [Candidatus Altiarchaeota archaeon]